MIMKHINHRFVDNYEDYKNKMDNQKIIFEKFLVWCCIFIFNAFTTNLFYDNFHIKDKIITLFTEIDLENIITQN